MKKSQIFPSRWLKADDIGDAEIRVVISKVTMEELGETREEKAVAHFEGKSKALVVNMINYDANTNIAGSDDTDDWAGTAVTLYTAPATFRGRTAPAIRIKGPPKQKHPAAAGGATPPPRPPQSDIDDEIPF